METTSDSSVSTVTVLTINQPWAGLILREYKWTEIRSWRSRLAGEVYIHANRWICPEAEQRAEFGTHSIEWELGIIGKVTMLPSVTVTQMRAFKQPHDGITPIEAGLSQLDIERLDWLRNNQLSLWGPNADIWEFVELEQEFSDQDRTKPIHNIPLGCPVMLDAPITAKGKLGFWKFDLPTTSRA